MSGGRKRATPRAVHRSTRQTPRQPGSPTGGSGKPVKARNQQAREARAARLELEAMRARHDEDGGWACLTSGESGLPPITDEPGLIVKCVCGRPWQLQDVSGRLLWRPPRTA